MRRYKAIASRPDDQGDQRTLDAQERIHRRRRHETQRTARINNTLEQAYFQLFRMTIQPLQVEGAGEHFEWLQRMPNESGKIVAPDQVITVA